MKQTCDVGKMEGVRVGILGPDTTCYAARVRRGVELGIWDRRVMIGSLNPQKIKEALRPREVAADDRPEYRRVKLNMARRRRIPVHQNWGVLDPQKMRAMSA